MTHKTNNIADIVSVTADIGDDFVNKYKKTNQPKDAQLALDAYKTCISATKAQLIHKKLTGSPVTIQFLK